MAVLGRNEVEKEIHTLLLQSRKCVEERVELDTVVLPEFVLLIEGRRLEKGGCFVESFCWYTYLPILKKFQWHDPRMVAPTD